MARISDVHTRLLDMDTEMSILFAKAVKICLIVETCTNRLWSKTLQRPGHEAGLASLKRTLFKAIQIFDLTDLGGRVVT